MVLDPFEARAGCLDLRVNSRGADTARRVEGHETGAVCEGLDESAPTIRLGPGERIEKTIPSAGLAWKVHPEPSSAAFPAVLLLPESRSELRPRGVHRSACRYPRLRRGHAGRELGSVQYAKDGPVSRYLHPGIQAFILGHEGKRYMVRHRHSRFSRSSA